MFIVVLNMKGHKYFIILKPKAKTSNYKKKFFPNFVIDIDT